MVVIAGGRKAGFLSPLSNVFPFKIRRYASFRRILIADNGSQSAGTGSFDSGPA
jgi:hypothetical protein